MIVGFRDKATEDIFVGTNSREARKIPQVVWGVARHKLDMLNAAVGLQDLRVPPANRLEALAGNLKGFHSVRINDQYRVIFVWGDGGASQVQVTDYHS